MARENYIILIPALEPDKGFSSFLEDLLSAGFKHIIVVDDGSSPAYVDRFFDARRLGCVVLRHGENRGKGAAIRTALQTALERKIPADGWITVDADGQHLPEDVCRIAQAMDAHPGALVLGIRDLTRPGVPLRSRLGNWFTAWLFCLTCGIACPDTQTGLRGIPSSLADLALRTEGDRYEYEMNFLMDAVRVVPVEYIPIQTVYLEGNRASHFRPLWDSIRVYGRFLRFTCASLSGAAVDYLLFCLLDWLLPLESVWRVTAATVGARLCSGIVNFLLNRKWSFRSRQCAGPELVRYLSLFFGQMAASAALVAALEFLMPAAAAKLMVDTILFFFSYRIQKNWVFRQEGSNFATSSQI